MKFTQITCCWQSVLDTVLQRKVHIKLCLPTSVWLVQIQDFWMWIRPERTGSHFEEFRSSFSSPNNEARTLKVVCYGIWEELSVHSSSLTRRNSLSKQRNSVCKLQLETEWPGAVFLQANAIIRPQYREFLFLVHVYYLQYSLRTKKGSILDLHNNTQPARWKEKVQLRHQAPWGKSQKWVWKMTKHGGKDWNKMMDTNARLFADVSKTAQFIVSFKKNCKHSGCFLLVFVGSENFLAPYVVSSNFQKVVILIQQINGCLPWLNVPYYSTNKWRKWIFCNFHTLSSCGVCGDRALHLDLSPFFTKEVQ